MTTEGRTPYGYAEKTGAWDIDLDPVAMASVEAFNEKVDQVTSAFAHAFAEIGKLEYAEGTFTEIGSNGRVLNVWSEVPLVVQDGRFRPAPDAQPSGQPERIVLSSAMLTYSVAVTQGDAANQVNSHPDALYFHYDSGISGVVGDLAGSQDAFARVDMEVDPWVDAPLHGGRFLDNRAIAALNRPRLEKALRRWEAETGKPIDHQTSVPYPALIDRYGFRPGGEPDPP